MHQLKQLVVKQSEMQSDTPFGRFQDYGPLFRIIANRNNVDIKIL